MPSIRAMEQSFTAKQWRRDEGIRKKFYTIQQFVNAVERAAALLAEGSFAERVAALEARFEAHRVALAPHTTSKELSFTGYMRAYKDKDPILSKVSF